MGDITEPRATAQKIYEGRRVHTNITVAAGVTLYHGTLGGFDASQNAKDPGSGVESIGRVWCPNGVSAAAGTSVSIEEGSFAWDLLSGASWPAIGAAMYAASNHEVSDDPSDGVYVGTYEGVFDGLHFVKSGFGVGVAPDGT